MKRRINNGNEFQDEVEDYFRKIVQDGSVVNRGTRPGADIAIKLNNIAVSPQKSFKFLIQAKGTDRRINIDSLVNEYENRVRRERVDRALIIINSMQINAVDRRGKTVKFDDDLRDKYLKRRNVLIWDRKSYDCYKKLIETLGPTSIYQLLSDFKFNAYFDKKHVYKAPYFSVNQKDTEFKITKIPPEILVKTGYVLRRNLDVTNGFQRLLNKRRVNTKIPEDIAAPEPAERLFPSSVICYYSGRLDKEGKNTLLLPLKYGQLRILDGQHRIYGIANAKGRGVFELPCVIIEETLNGAQQAQLFVSVNKKAVKPPANLLLDLDRDGMLTKLTKRLNESRIFDGAINFNELSEKEGSISATTFINGGGLRSILDEKLKRGQKIRTGYLKNVAKDDFDSYYVLLNNYFDLWKKAFKKQWGKANRYMIASNRGIRIMFRFFKPLLEIYGKPQRKIARNKILKLLKYLQKRINEKHLSKISDVKGEYYGEGGANRLFYDLVSLAGEKDLDFEYKTRPFKDSLELHGIKGREELRDVLSRAHNDILIVDRYFDRNALSNVQTELNCKSIRILTTDEHSINDLRREYNDLKTELATKGINIDIRVLNRRSYENHFLVIILDNKVDYSGDTRLNQLGKNITSRIQLNKETQATKDLSEFNKLWNIATKIENYDTNAT